MDKLWISLFAILVGLCVPTRAVGVYNLKTTLTGDSEDTLQKWVTSGSQSGARIGVHPTFSSAMNLPAQALWCGNEQSEYIIAVFLYQTIKGKLKTLVQTTLLGTHFVVFLGMHNLHNFFTYQYESLKAK